MSVTLRVIPAQPVLVKTGSGNPETHVFSLVQSFIRQRALLDSCFRRSDIDHYVYWRNQILVNREISTAHIEAKVLIADWRKEYNQFQPHSSLHCRAPAPEARMPVTLTLRLVPLMGAGQATYNLRRYA